ncbi:hypothetical protein Nepgr_007962 [Nepenthes gracilis]|uniref:Uncharacterized protein n=1 Tax=Nepenthes gracilis TaxID=150966 RepID=A0AAD3S8Q1_NEPGR|nr:hypothetical protein Nepgr_007962 [Nepenthes gracilis]
MLLLMVCPVVDWKNFSVAGVSTDWATKPWLVNLIPTNVFGPPLAFADWGVAAAGHACSTQQEQSETDSAEEVGTYNNHPSTTTDNSKDIIHKRQHGSAKIERLYNTSYLIVAIQQTNSAKNLQPTIHSTSSKISHQTPASNKKDQAHSSAAVIQHLQMLEPTTSEN